MKPSVAVQVALSLLAIGCGGGPTPSGAPVPANVRVTLRFGRGSAVRYHYAARDQLTPGSQGTRLEGWQAWAVAERILYLTEGLDDSLGTHLVRVRVDSSRGGSGDRVSYGPFPGFVGNFGDRRERIDTAAGDPDVEGLRELVFRGVVPLPAAPVAVGESWTIDAAPQVRHAPTPVPPAWDRAKGTVRRIRLVDGDTLADLALSLHINSAWAPQGLRERDIVGDLTGEETFSITRGVTVELRLKGRIEVYESNVQIFSLNEVVERDLLP